MEWIADPMTAGGWFAERLDDDWSIHHFVPHGFEAYARVFHPAQVYSEADAAGTTATWAEAAAAFGTTLHAQASWQHLVRTPPDGDWRSRIAPDGREFTEGDMSAELLAAIARHLVAHTSTPDAGYAAIWEGWGGLVGGLSVSDSSGAFGFTDDEVHAQVLQQSFNDRFNNPFRKPKWRSGILSDEISKGPRLVLPDRSHVLFSAAPSTFANTDWVLDAPWRRRELPVPAAQHPSILWPADHAWAMVSEIDYDSTIVAGSRALVKAICTAQDIEALPISEGSSLHWDADEINR